MCWINGGLGLEPCTCQKSMRCISSHFFPDEKFRFVTCSAEYVPLVGDCHGMKWSVKVVL